MIFTGGWSRLKRNLGSLLYRWALLLDHARAALIPTYGLSHRCHFERRGQCCEHRREAIRLRNNLHDGLGPALAGMIMGVEVVRRVVRDDPRRAEQILGELQKEATEVMAEFRWTLANGSPRELQGDDFDAALRTLVKRLVTSNDDAPSIEVEVARDVASVDRRQRIVAFWIIKEALNNIVKHSCADFCSVRLWTDHGLYLEVADNGRGGVGVGGAGMGLASMTHRARELGGWCDIRDAHPGVVVSAYLPGD